MNNGDVLQTKIDIPIPGQTLPASNPTSQVPPKQTGYQVPPKQTGYQAPPQQKKLAPRFVGPFPITKVISPAAIRLRLPRSLRVHPTFHVSQVKPTKDNPMVPVTKPPQPLEAADGGSLYKVKSLLAVRNRGRGKQFLVDWEGYGPEERQWIPRSYIDDPSLIQDFYRDHPELPGPSGVGPRRGGSVTPR